MDGAPESPELSVLIPVYRESQTLDLLLEKLCSVKKTGIEVIVMIDEPTDDMKRLSLKYLNARFMYNSERIGKANALNAMLREAKAQKILFLDSDVTIPGDPEDFISKTVEALDHYDFVEYKEVVRLDGSLRSRLIRFDDAMYNFTCMLFSKTTGRCFALSGAALAAKREVLEELGGFRRVIQEDIDLGTRAFLSDKVFAMLSDLEVNVEPPKSWRAWFKQRRRWFTGYGAWLKCFLPSILLKLMTDPKLLTPILIIVALMSFPAAFSTFVLPGVMTGLFVEPFAKSHQALVTTDVALVMRHIVGVKSTSHSYEVMLGAMKILFGYLTYALIFSSVCRSVGEDFDFKHYLLYSLGYSIATLCLLGLYVLRGLMHGNKPLPDWKL